MKKHFSHIVLLVVFFLFGCGPDKIDITASSVDSIKVNNVYLLTDYDQRLITNRDTITAICQSLNKARLVSIDTINIRLSTSQCDMYVYTRNEGKLHFYYKTTEDYGNLLWYSSGNFRSDSLIYWLK